MTDKPNKKIDAAEQLADNALDQAQGAGFASWASQLKKTQKKQTQAIADLAKDAFDD